MIDAIGHFPNLTEVTEGESEPKKGIRVGKRSIKMVVLTNIRAWMSKLRKKLTELLTRRREVEEEAEPAPGVLTALDKKLGKEILERQARRKVDTRQGGPNMPWSQPCPICRRRSKRVEKIDAGPYRGAYYRCPNPKHGRFFVRAR